MTHLLVITKTEFVDAGYPAKMGSLMFPAEYYDCKHHVDCPKLKKSLIRDYNMPTGRRILKVLITTPNHAWFKNVSNTEIPYKNAVCADEKTDGAYRKNYPEMNFSMWATDFPVGDAVVVVSD